MLFRSEEYCPGFKGLVVGKEVLTPPDLERVFGLTGGVSPLQTEDGMGGEEGREGGKEKLSSLILSLAEHLPRCHVCGPAVHVPSLPPLP